MPESDGLEGGGFPPDTQTDEEGNRRYVLPPEDGGDGAVEATCAPGLSYEDCLPAD